MASFDEAPPGNRTTGDKIFRTKFDQFHTVDGHKQVLSMDPEAARSARESLDLAFHMSNILDTGIDRHALSILIALCDLGVNPEALAAIVKELRKERLPLSSLRPTPP